MLHLKAGDTLLPCNGGQALQLLQPWCKWNKQCPCACRTSTVTIQGILGALLTSSIFLGELKEAKSTGTALVQVSLARRNIAMHTV